MEEAKALGIAVNALLGGWFVLREVRASQSHRCCGIFRQ
jgi:hypothetical protein